MHSFAGDVLQVFARAYNHHATVATSLLPVLIQNVHEAIAPPPCTNSKLRVQGAHFISFAFSNFSCIYFISFSTFIRFIHYFHYIYFIHSYLFHSCQSCRSFLSHSTNAVNSAQLFQFRFISFRLMSFNSFNSCPSFHECNLCFSTKSFHSCHVFMQYSANIHSFGLPFIRSLVRSFFSSSVQ